MIAEGLVFEFYPPDDWTSFREGNQYVFQGHNEEELIVSGQIISNADESDESRRLSNELLQKTLKVAENAVNHPDLAVIRELKKETSESNDFEVWTIYAQTIDKEVLFYEAVFSASQGVLLITYEAPNTEMSKHISSQIINSVKLKP